jgi:hypothetical protein
MPIVQRPVPTQTATSRTERASQQSHRMAVASMLAGLGLVVTTAAHAKPFMEYIKPQPQVAPLSDATWGDPGVIPRDISNGIESTKGKGVHPQWYYWDGQIIKAKDGKYHMFMSTFDANTNFGTGWMNSDAYHAISETNVLGPYVRKDYPYTNNGSHKGHNVSAAELPDGTYVVIVSEIVPFQLFKSSSLDGPWTGCSPQSDIGASNISMFPRHDGKYQIVERHGQIAISDTLCGHYVKKNPTCSYTQSSDAAGTIYPKRTSIPGVSGPQFTWQEDPHIWRSGGTYHIIYSGSGDRVGWHVYSPDGLTGWKDNGYAWSPRDYKKIFCYEGSDHCDAWYKMERPSVVLQDGHPTHITWAVADVDKDSQVTPGSNHGTKVVVIPFDGVAFDNDFGDGSAGGSGGSTGTGGTTGTAGSTGTSSSGTGGTRGGSTATGGNTGTAGATGGRSTGGAVSTATGGSTSRGGSVSSSSGVSGGAGAGGSTTSSASGGSSSPVSSISSSSSSNGGSSSAGGASASGGSRSFSSASVVDSGGSSGSRSSAISTASGGNESGCDCAFGSAKRHGAVIPGLLLGALGVMLVRRRHRRRR